TEQDNSTWSEIQLQQAMLLKTTLKQQHFPSVISVGRKEIAIIVFLNQETANQDKVKLRHALQTIRHFQETAVFMGEDYFFGASRASQDIKKETECYQEPKQLLFLQQYNIDMPYLFEEIELYHF